MMADSASRRTSSETDNFETSSLHAAIFAAGDRIAQSRSKSPTPPIPPLPSNSTTATARSTISAPSTANTISTPPSSIFPPIIPQSSSDFTLILPNLYISSLRGAGNALELSRHNITHILSVTVSKPFLIFPESSPREVQIQHHHVGLIDEPSAPLLQLLPEITSWIYHALRSPDAVVLVHCESGDSRSPSAVIGYIMAVQDVSFREALRMVKEKRRNTNPNLGFVRSLSKWASAKTDWWEYGKPKDRSLEESFKGLDGVATIGASEREVDVGSEGSTLEGQEGTGEAGDARRIKNHNNRDVERSASEMELKAGGHEKVEKKGWRAMLRKLRCW